MHFKIILLQFTALFLLSCATPYQPIGGMGGYSEVEAGENRYIVSFSGNGFTPVSTVENYAYRRANEICQRKGYERAEVIDDRTDTETTKNPDSYNCSATATTHGSSTTINSNCYNSGGWKVNKHSTRILVSCKGGESEESSLVSKVIKYCDAGDADACAHLANQSLKEGDLANAGKVAKNSCQAGSEYGCIVLSSVGSEKIKNGHNLEGRKDQETACRQGNALSCSSAGAGLIAEGDQARGSALLQTACSLDEPNACRILSEITKDRTKKQSYETKARELFTLQCKEKRSKPACQSLVEMNLDH